MGIRWKRFKIPQKSVENMERKWGKMKKKWYKKSGIKAFFICLTIVFLVTACVSAGASVYVMSKGVQPLDSRKYVDSESFTDSVYSMSHTILELSLIHI